MVPDLLQAIYVVAVLCQVTVLPASDSDQSTWTNQVIQQSSTRNLGKQRHLRDVSNRGWLFFVLLFFKVVTAFVIVVILT